MGTGDFPHDRIIKGSELCTGGAEALPSTGKETMFDLRKRRQAMKTTSGYIKSVGPCVVMPQAEPRPGLKTCRPDTYIQITYKKGEVEWIPRMEYTQLVGEKCCERQLKQLIAIYTRGSSYMDACKRAGIHPKTQ
jgi:hypothetical protein